MSSTIYILYNAKVSLLGKISYACKKISGADGCEACDLTHGGLRLDETAEWKATKKRIGAKVEQLHIDELSNELNQFINAHQLRFPLVLGKANAGSLKTLITADSLGPVSKSHEAFLKLLKERADAEKIPLTIT